MVRKSVELLTDLRERAGESWLVGYNLQKFNCLTEELFEQLIESKEQGNPPRILLSESDSFRFIASFLAAVAANCPIFLCNHNWRQQEWQQVFELVQPNVVWGHVPEKLIHKVDKQIPFSSSVPIMLPTGGTSGKIRFAMHTWETLTASVKGFHRYFGSKPINSFCVLPLYHVSGLMQFLRSFLTGGKLLIYPYTVLKGDRPNIEPSYFISLVPTQLQYLLHSDPQWLSCFQTVLLGGAPAWQSLLDAARSYRIPLAPTYGMTETASQVVTLKPEDFLRGNNSSGQILPHAQVTVRSDRETLENQVGEVTIKAKSLCLGYYPNLSNTEYFQTDDLGYFDAQGYLHIVGRHSQKIVTGGENVFPTEVEAAILATQLIEDVCVIGLSDRTWGQAVTAVYVPKALDVTPEAIQIAIKDKLSKFKQPKYWVPVETLPRNAQGKVNYQQLNQLATARVLGRSRKILGETKSVISDRPRLMSDE